MDRNVTSVFPASLNCRDGDLIVSGNAETLKLVAVNHTDRSDNTAGIATIVMDSELEIARLYETLGKILGK